LCQDEGLGDRVDEKRLIFPWPALINHISGDPDPLCVVNTCDYGELQDFWRKKSGNIPVLIGGRGSLQK